MTAPGRTLTRTRSRQIQLKLRQERDRLHDQLAGLLPATVPGSWFADAQPDDLNDLSRLRSELAEATSLAADLDRLLEQVTVALQRLDDGSYGRCERCGLPIDAERLEALAHVTTCTHPRPPPGDHAHAASSKHA